MRIAMVSEHASPLAALGEVDAGGQNVHVAALATQLGATGVEVVVHTRRDDPSLPARARLAPGVEVHHVDAGPARRLPKDELLPYMSRFAVELERVWRQEPPALVHAHFWMSGRAALAAAQRLRIPVIETFHALGVVKRRYQGVHDTSPRERIDIERDIVRRVAQIIATCTDELFELVRFGAERSKLAVIPCGVDLDRFRPDGPREPTRAGVDRLVCVGRLVQRKGIGNVISALSQLPDCELVVAGGPAGADLEGHSEARRLRALAVEHGVADRVELRGRVERAELPALLRSAALVVCVPWYEPFGIVPLEAMACGVPVVASAVGGMVDTILDDRTGVHVPPRDPERLTGAVRELLDEPDRRAVCGRRGVERARRLYGWQRIAGLTQEVYADVIARFGRPRRQRSRQRPPDGREHLAALDEALDALAGDLERLERWGAELGRALADGARLLAVGNGGSAAQAQHLTAELVGRFETERRPLSAICLHGDTSSLTAIANDYGHEQAFARQVLAHGRPGDALLALSTSGRSPNVVAAVQAAHEVGLMTLALTGTGPNPLTEACDEAVSIRASWSATVQEAHLIALHIVCRAVDRELALADGRPMKALA
jgi:glycosyltransferase involved in cell wall biosynthesis/phosphoheptose isomerase